MVIALRYIGRRPKGQRNLVHPVDGQHYQFFTDKRLPATPIDETWADSLLALKDKEGRPLFLAETTERPVVDPKTIRCKRCEAQFSNMGDFLAHTRKEHRHK